VAPVAADTLRLPLANTVMDGAVTLFGSRELADLDAGLREAHRGLAPGARFVILELCTPRVLHSASSALREFCTPRSAIVRGIHAL